MSIFETLLTENKSALIQENDDGFIEYKWKLDSKNELSIKKLVSQLLWRLNEGKEETGIYEAHYVLGVYDNGIFGKLTRFELNGTVEIFFSILEKANAEVVYE